MVNSHIDAYWDGYLEAVKDASAVLDAVTIQHGQRMMRVDNTVNGCKSALLNLVNVPYQNGWEPQWSRNLAGSSLN